MYFGVQQIVKPSQKMINFKYRGEIATPASFCESASSILYSLLGRLADLYLAHPVVPICFTWVCIPSEVVLAVPVAAVSKPSDQPNRRIQFLSGTGTTRSGRVWSIKRRTSNACAA
eukprot:COSAG05_NODE_2956_length_2466_cov_8.473595_1_plen_116_part_00